MLRNYTRGLDVLGDATVGPGFVGPLSPAQLAQADRKLTPLEQKAVDDFQSKQGDAMQAAEEAKGGPKASTVSVTPQGAVVRSVVPARSLAVASAGSFFDGIPAWQLALGAVGVLAIVYGVYTVAQPTQNRSLRYA